MINRALAFSFVDMAVFKSQNGTAPFTGFIPLCCSFIAYLADERIPGQYTESHFIDPGNCQIRIDKCQTGMKR